MSSTIIIKNSATSGSIPSSLVQGEMAINVTNGRLFYGSGSGNEVKEFTTPTVSASYAVSSSYALSASYAFTSSYSISSSYALSSSYSLTSTSASYAATASNAQNAADILIYVKNVTGAQIDKGKVVRISGATGDNPLISTASYENDNNSANTLGITTQNIPNDSFGYVMTEGTLLGINTDSFTAGQLLYLGATGSIIGTAPIAPLHAVRLGQVLRVQAINGSMYVRIDNGYELGELHDVIDSTTTSSYGDLLVKSGSVWINSKQLTGSYAITGSLTATSITSSLLGTASFAVTASYALNAGASSIITSSLYSFTQSSPATTWSINHNLNEVYPIVNVYSGSFAIIPSQIKSINSNNLEIYFTIPTTGYATIVGKNLLVSGSSVSASYAATASYLEGFVTSASYAATASYLNPLRQDVIITGSIYFESGSYIFINNQDTTIRSGVNGTISGDLLLTNYDGAQYVKTNDNGTSINNLTVDTVLTANNMTGSLFGTASYARNALSASYAPSSGLKTKSNVITSSSFSGTPLKSTVTFSTPFINNNYSVNVTGEDARSWTIESKVSGSFIVNSNSSLALAGNTYWIAVAYGED